MGKHLKQKRSGVQFIDSQPGCMHGILDFHNWHNVMKMLPHKRHGGGRHARANEDLVLLNSEDRGGDGQGSTGADSNYFRMYQPEQRTKKTKPTKKISTTARMKALISSENKVFGFSARPKLQRTYSIHHLEPLADNLDEINTDWKCPIILLQTDTSASKPQGLPPTEAPEKLVARNNEGKSHRITNSTSIWGQNQLFKNNTPFTKSCVTGKNGMDAKEQHRDISGQQFKEYMDVLEIYRINKDLFMNRTQISNVDNLDRLHSLQKSTTRAKLTKSGSFPVADQSPRRNLVPAKLEHKHREIWSIPKRENILACAHAPLASRSLKDLYENYTPLMVDNIAGSTEEAVIFPPGSPPGLNEIETFLLTNCSMDNEQRIGNAIVMQEVGITDKKVMDEKCEASIMDKNGEDSVTTCFENDGSHFDLRKHSLYRVRRASSLNDTLDRYAQLFESSSKQDAKLNLSKSLKLKTEDEMMSGWSDTKHFRRTSSMRDPMTCSALQNEASESTHNSGMVTNLSSTYFGSYDHDQPDRGVPLDPDNCASLRADIAETSQDLMQKGDESLTQGCISELTVGINDPGIATLGEVGDVSELQEIGFTKIVHEGVSNLVSETSIKDDISCIANVEISEGGQMNLRSIKYDEAKSSDDIQNRSSTEVTSVSWAIVTSKNVENVEKTRGDHFLPINLNRENDAAFKYVRYILESLGVIGNQNSKHSEMQPVDISFSNDKDAQLPGGNCDNQLRFDSVYDTLLEVYERSYTYWPRALSPSCRVRPTSSGNHILEEVWTGICKQLSSIPGPDSSLDQIVALDFKKDDGWMNFQADSECVALDLGDIIFDEILDEILCD